MIQKTKKALKEFENKFGSYKIDDGELRQYSIWENLKTFIIGIIKKETERERDDIWKWIGENSWTQDSPTGEVRVIDVDELADYWRKQSHFKKSHQMTKERTCKNCGMIDEDLDFEDGCKK